MLCEKCKSVIKPVVALDIDGTLGDYHGHFLNFARMWLGESRWRAVEYAPKWGGEGRYRDWFTQTLEVDLTTFRAIKLAYRQGGLKRWMPIEPGSAALIESLRAHGADVFLVTTRPFERFDRVDPDTREWLKRNELEFDGLIYDENKVQILWEVCGERVCFFLDDEKRVLEEADGYWPGATVLKKSIWNRNSTWPVMADQLDVVRQMARAHIEDWNIKHQFDELPETT